MCYPLKGILPCLSNCQGGAKKKTLQVVFAIVSYITLLACLTSRVPIKQVKFFELVFEACYVEIV